MYIYKQTEPSRTTVAPGLWTVGYYTPDGQWVAESDHDSLEAAAARVNYLNGGTGASDQNRVRWLR